MRGGGQGRGLLRIDFLDGGLEPDSGAHGFLSLGVGGRLGRIEYDIYGCMVSEGIPWTGGGDTAMHGITRGSEGGGAVASEVG